MTAGLATVAATILRRMDVTDADKRPHAFSHSSTEDGETIEVGSTVGGTSLFVLVREKTGRVSLDSSVLGQNEWTDGELKAVEPDPLWESACSICSHMEDDHSDTFGLFLGLVGQERLSHCTDIRMPWVEADGFYLTAQGEHHFIPFPQRCEDANSVRATLIKMLRGARAAHSTH